MSRGRSSPPEVNLDGVEHPPSASMSPDVGTNAGVRMVRVDPDAEKRFAW